MKTLKLEELISEDTPFVILYGSQLGNAEAIAEGLLDSATSEYSLNPKLLTLNELSDITQFARIKCPVVIVTSTTGDGEAPENADKFLRKLRRKVLKPNTLESVRYTILGLGDTNFNNFCNGGKLIHRRLQELGAKTFYDPAWADDAVGLDQVVDPWIENLWPNLALSIEGSDSLSFISTSSTGERKTARSPINKLLRKMSSNKSSENSSEAAAPSADKISLTLPSCPSSSLVFEYRGQFQPKLIDLQNPPAPYPLIDGDPFSSSIVSARVLTAAEGEKTTVELTLHFDNSNFEFEPGDAVGIVCPNSKAEVQSILETLGIKNIADKTCTISLREGSKGKFPTHIPKENSIRQLLLWYCDIRSPPKKALLRLFAESATEETEKNVLMELCSKQGASLYEKYIRISSTSLLDILLSFPSCKPRIEALIEHLPRLAPRPYSISSSPLISSDTFTIAFNIIKFPQNDKACDTKYRKYNRLGVGTGWLYNIGKKYFDEVSSLMNSFQAISMNEVSGGGGDQPEEKVIFYKRKNHFFRLPKALDSSVIMVGPGTGVAPFIGFIQHRLQQRNAGEKIGKMSLFFGCRHKAQDYIYKETLESFSSKNDQLINVSTSFSRDIPKDNEVHIKYVQDMLYLNRTEIVGALLKGKGYFYVCGDAKNMAKNVREKLIQCVQEVEGITEKEAIDKISELVTEKRYLQDVWS